MLRYFYILICIQLCFCTEYIDNTEKEIQNRRIRSKSILHRKHTKSTKKSRVVHFDVGNFIGKSDEEAGDDRSYGYRSRVQENRRVPANYGDYGSFIESNENNKEMNKAVDYSNLDDNGFNKEPSPSKEVNARHFNYHALAFDDKNDLKSQQIHSHDRAVTGSTEKMVADRDLLSDPERKCSFKNMKMPFFSYNKSTTKAKRQKKRKLFCFNCHKTSSTSPNQFDDTSEIKNDEFPKNHNANDKRDIRQRKAPKRTYDQLCPKCIRELLNSLKKKTTKKAKHGTKPNNHKESKATTKAKTTILDKPDTLEDKLEDSYYYPSVVRQKREEEGDQERDRRLKELEEVERKIDSVQVTSPTIMKVSLTVDH